MRESVSESSNRINKRINKRIDERNSKIIGEQIRRANPAREFKERIR